MTIKPLKPPSVIAADWSAIRYVPLVGKCETCGLPIGALSMFENEPIAYRIPAIAGWFHSICCIECRLFGPNPHSCRWCGREIVGPANQRFCDEPCARLSNDTPFGNGKRLLNYLLTNLPNIGNALCGKTQAERTCRNCGGQKPEEKRSDADFCSEGCKKRFRRMGNFEKK